MKINPKFIQFDCVEGDKTDLRQANAVLKYQPDIIIFEMPQGRNGPDTIFNHYSCNKKPLIKVEKIIKKLKTSAKKYPYALSDVAVWNNIVKMWQQNINTQIYNVDTPDRVRRESIIFKAGYPSIRRDWLFWVYLYIRDSFMAKNIKEVITKYEIKKTPIVLIFLQSIHWKNVKFLLSNPSGNNIWQYYFGRFRNMVPGKEMDKQIKKKSKILGYYWDKLQGFY